MAREIHPYLQANEFSLDDVVFPIADIPEFEPGEVDPSVQLTKRIHLKRPIIGSPMDTVTGPEMAILLAKMGGIGVIHQGYSIEQQVEAIKKVRRWEAGFVLDPAVLGLGATVGDVLKGERERGFTSYPITQDGTLQSPIVGIVTKRDVRDLRGEPDQMTPVEQVMTSNEKLICARREDTLDIRDIKAANAIMRANRLDTLPIVDDNGLVVALITRSDIEKDERYSLATKDENKSLKVLAAVGSRFSTARDRVEAIANTGVSGIVIDSRQLYGGYVEIAKLAKELNPNLDVIVGNMVHPMVLRKMLDQAGHLIDAIRANMGTGEVCITAEDLGLTRAGGSTLLDLDRAFHQLNEGDKYGFIGFVLDGGVKFPRHFLAGAMLHRNFAGVMMGSGIAGFEESLARRTQRAPGVYVKRVRGMGSIGAIMDRAGADRYRVDQLASSEVYAEGIEKDVPAIGSGEPYIARFFGGVQGAMHGLGAHNIQELYDNAVLYPVAKAASKGTL